MTEPIPVGEDDLQAYLDRRLTPERTGVVEAYLAAHPEAAARMARYVEHQGALKAALQAKVEEPIPPRMRVESILAAQRRRRGAAFTRIAAAILLLLGGGVCGWYANDWASIAQPMRHVTANAADAYRTFVVDARHPVEVRAEDKSHLEQWLSSRLGRPVTAPDLASLGFRLMGGRLLPTAHVPAAQLMYDDHGMRLTLYLQPMGIPGSEFRYTERAGVRTVYWAERRMAFAVTAQTGQGRLLEVAHSVYDQLSEPARASAEHGSGL